MATIKEVKSFEDIKVKIVTSFPDLLVYVTDKINEAKGEDGIWFFDDKSNHPDQKIKFVTSFEDLKIQYTKNINQAGWKNKKHRLQNRIG